MENKREICRVVNGEMIQIPQKTPQEKIEIVCAERVGGVYFTTADELEKYIEQSRKVFEKAKIESLQSKLRTFD